MHMLDSRENLDYLHLHNIIAIEFLAQPTSSAQNYIPKQILS